MAFEAVCARTARETEMMCIRKLAVAALILVAGAPAALTQTAIKVSYQPALYWSLPYFVASEKGFWTEAGLKPEFSTFPAGAPQVAAAQASPGTLAAWGRCRPYFAQPASVFTPLASPTMNLRLTC